MLRLIPPQTGPWPCPGRYPERIRLGGRLYVRARWRWPRPGVAAQYREARDEHARHLYVRQDGTWTIDHLDEHNPDRLGIWDHFWKDVL